MGQTRCKLHGVIERDGKYCPVCGKEIYEVHCYPFSFYLNRKGLAKLWRI